MSLLRFFVGFHFSLLADSGTFLLVLQDVMFFCSTRLDASENHTSLLFIFSSVIDLRKAEKVLDNWIEGLFVFTINLTINHYIMCCG